MKKIVLSLFDYTGAMVRPWAEDGYECYIFDIQHNAKPRRQMFAGGGSITKVWWDADQGVQSIIDQFKDQSVRFVFGFSPCDDLSVAGAKHFAKKLAADPDCQAHAVRWARLTEELGEALGADWMAENPVSMLASLWRKPDHYFHPYQFGGYIPEDKADHPIWPDYIAPRDAYPKKTCLWTSEGFNMPEHRPVEPIKVAVELADGSFSYSSKQFAKLGGKSLKTKNIRSATPRGLAIAVKMANGT